MDTVYVEPTHVNVSGSPSAQYLVVALIEQLFGQVRDDVEELIAVGVTRVEPVRGGETAPFVVSRVFSAKTVGLALTSISATPLFAHVPSSTTHATYLSVTAGEPGHALLPRGSAPRGRSHDHPAVRVDHLYG